MSDMSDMAETERGRVLGVDAGTVRIGVAISDPQRLVATPLETLPGVGDHGADTAAAAAGIINLARDHDCRTVVVGLPRALSGGSTASTAMAESLAGALRTAGVEVQVWDERLSSTEAERLLIGAGRRRKQRKQERDRVAATIILQGWLDAQRF